MSYMYRLKPEILKIHPIPPFNFSYTVPLRQFVGPSAAARTDLYIESHEVAEKLN